MTENRLSPGDAHDSPKKMRKHQVGIYGWRKRCLYGFILFIFAIIVINLALTIWIIRVMDFSIGGMGNLRFIANSVRMDGESEFTESLYASKIKTRNREPLYVESGSNITIQARDYLNRVVNELRIGGGKVESIGEIFTVSDRNGNTQFSVDEDGLKLGGEKIAVSGGLAVQDAVQTPLVSGPSRDSLRILSLTREVKIAGPRGVQVRAPAGNIHISSLDDILIESKTQMIRLDSENVFFMNLAISAPSGVGTKYPDVYQLCVCKDSGRLFIDKPDGQCRGTDDICN